MLTDTVTETGDAVTPCGVSISATAVKEADAPSRETGRVDILVS
jgi:hypothetical protein